MATRPEEQLAKMIADLPSKTGKSLDDWLKILKTKGLDKHKQIRIYLQEEHGVSYGYANQIALRAVHGGTADWNGDPADEIYAGAKEALRPIHDTLMSEIESFGDDVDVAPKKGYVSIRRAKQFAMIQPSTATRVDLGINLKGVEPIGRLEASGSWNGMFTHRVRLASVDEIDSEVFGWLRRAYDAAN